MARAIEFRGVVSDSWVNANGKFQKGEMVFGSLIGWENPCIVLDEKTSSVKGLMVGIAVDPATVGQLIGIPDKSGAKIFEGDVVRFSLRGTDDLQPKYGEKGAVQITNYGPAFGGWAAEYCNNIEVLGNIHQNPELLEKK